MFFASMLFDPNDFSGGGILAAFIGVYLIVIVVMLAVVIIPFWFILKKAGFSPWLSLINIVPFGTLILLYVLAFAQWKVVPAPQPGWQQPPYPPLPPQA
jgi:glycerol-3-phosphate acyltransferase PlsY